MRKIWRRITDPSYRATRRQIKQFQASHGRGTPIRYDGLNPGDVVLDIGGYQGEWAESMAAKYGVKVYVFEPHPKFAKKLKSKFQNQPQIKVFDFALGSADGVICLSDNENASSALISSENSVMGTVRAVAPALEALSLNTIAVAKINIEGGEYDLLPALYEAGLLERIERLTIQFHRYYAENEEQREHIIGQLTQTHDCSWSYPFIWEEWQLRGLGH